MDGEYIKGLVTRTFHEWVEDDAKTVSAALAYYLVLSLPALLLLSVSVGSIFLRSKQIQENILGYMEGAVDQRVIEMIGVLFEQIPETYSLSLSVLVSFVIILWSASSVFRQLKTFIEKMWDVTPVEPNGIKTYAKNTLVSFVIVMIFGGLLVISILLESILYTFSKLFQVLLPFPPVFAHYAGSIASFLVLVLFFMSLYRVLPDTNLELKPVFVGSLVTVILITIGKFAMGIYFAYSSISSIYGAIGSILGLFLLLYYSSIMITIGAEFTKVYSES